LLIAIPEVVVGRIAGVMLAPLVLITSASFEAVAPLPLAAQMWSGTRSAAKRLFAVVDAEPAVRESGDRTLPAARRTSPTPSLEFSDLSFTYPGEVTPAVKHISFGLRAGQKIAIVGPSGAGKSTLASLLLRFWDFDSGEICLDGHSIKRYAPDEVREQVALISPNTYFFNTSIYENLRMARRRVTREEIEAAAQAAQIHELIVRLPKGYGTLIGEQGLRLSGGERQRLAIARAILKDAPILLLDEPTANLDAVTEEKMLTMLFQMMEKKACLLITHRLIGLEHVDQILVMNHGRIVERGSQASLLTSDGLYRRLWALQNRFLIHP
jgi:ABC-type multidrug transport system fused ATPase/permease subunit